MVRWTYLIPRIAILALIALAIWVGADPLCQRIVVSKIQAATGAKFEVGQLRYSWANQKIYLKDVAIADPRSPMRNLVQAEMAYLEIEADSLLNRQIVINNGEASHVIFGAPRTESGSLPGALPIDSKEKPTWKPKKFKPIENVGLEWLDLIPINNLVAPTSENLELVQATRQLSNFWQTELPVETQNIANLIRQRENLTAELEDDGNPLRKQYVKTDADYNQLAKRQKEINARLIELERTALADKKRLSLAFNHDIQKLRQAIRATSFDSNSVSNLLLTRFQEDRVAEIVGWFHWFRSTVPNLESDFQSKGKRGVDVNLPGVGVRPGFLIKAIDLEGEGRFANRHVNFAGTAYNLTTEPKIHNQPATFELRALQGDQNVKISCTIDRRGELPIDSMEVLCPNLKLPEQMLGEENSLLVTMGPSSRIQADIYISANGDQLTGELVFRHSDVSLHVDKLNDIVGGANTALQMNRGLASIDQFESRVTLSGTIDDYDYQFQSDLGGRFANAANQLLQEMAEREIEQGREELQTLLANQLTNLDNKIIPEIHRLARLLKQERVEIARRQETQSQEPARLPEIPRKRF